MFNNSSILYSYCTSTVHSSYSWICSHKWRLHLNHAFIRNNKEDVQWHSMNKFFSSTFQHIFLLLHPLFLLFLHLLFFITLHPLLLILLFPPENPIDNQKHQSNIKITTINYTHSSSSLSSKHHHSHYINYSFLTHSTHIQTGCKGS